MITSATIQDFTVFRSTFFEFVPGINVLIGANASGKTHLLKLLYSIQKSQYECREVQRTTDFAHQLNGVFRPESISNVIRSSAGFASVAPSWNLKQFRGNIISDGKSISFSDNAVQWPDCTLPVLIPVKDMLAHSVGFISLYDQRNIDFDQTHRDILSFASTPTLRDIPASGADNPLEILAKALDATVQVQGERFYLDGKHGRFEMHMVAEGFRKLALLYQLIANGSVGPGTVLYWDEPETNLNPSLMDELIHVLLILARQGTQIFLATHDYIILKELELQKEKSDELRFFAMARNPKDGSVTPHPADTYSELKPNLIAEQFDRIYDLQIKRSLGSVDAK